MLLLLIVFNMKNVMQRVALTFLSNDANSCWIRALKLLIETDTRFIETNAIFQMTFIYLPVKTSIC